jgi:hypothetical protein
LPPSAPRGEELEELLGHGGRQLVQERGAIVRRHLVEDLRDLLLGHRLEEALLGLEREVLEHVRRQVARQHPEREHLLLHRQALDQARGGRGVQCFSISWRETKFRASMTRARSGVGSTAMTLLTGSRGSTPEGRGEATTRVMAGGRACREALWGAV